MSVFKQIAQSIGSLGDPVELPTLEKAEELFKSVTIGKSIPAFKEVFQLFRFGKEPENFEQLEVKNVIKEAFFQGSVHFNKPV